jgi:glycine betaine/proline transport system substrate-binding protein
MFTTAETGDKGQFLQGDPSWVYYDQDIIDNLALNLQVVQAGSEQSILAALDAAYNRQEPVLFYFWTPHSVHAKYELTQVQLPEYTDACGAKAGTGGVDCDYPQDVLYKAASAGLKDAAPEAYQLLKSMQYTNADQIAMIADVELNGKKPEEAARAWVDANQDVWKAWLPSQ